MSHSNNLYLVRNAIIYSYPFMMRILLKAAKTSSFVNHFARLI